MSEESQFLFSLCSQTVQNPPLPFLYYSITKCPIAGNTKTGAAGIYNHWISELPLTEQKVTLTSTKSSVPTFFIIKFLIRLF